MVSLELESEDGRPLPDPRPGQFVTLKLQPDPASTPIVRSYSLSGAPSGPRYRISVKVEPHGAAGRHIRAAVGLGDRLEVGAPRGVFVLDDSDLPVVLISAGVGVTPMLAMLHALHDAETHREVWWVHCARNRAEHTFAVEVQSLLDELAHGHRQVWYSRPDATDRAGIDYDAAGHITPAALADAGVPRDGEFYLCGPTAFMDALREGLATLGVAPERVHTEIFGAQGSLTPGVVAAPARPPHQPEGAAGTGPLISFVRSALNVHWKDGFANILELAEACDVPVRWSCRTGVCHTCETGLLDGIVEYSPEPLEAPADGNLLLCCARPTVDLAIDL